jgi:ParB family chromosome partitioning protein
MSKKTSFFSDVGNAVITQTPAVAPIPEPATGQETPRRRTDYLAGRAETLADLASGKIESRSLLWVDPAQCKIWEHHNRRYDLLNESNCADLIEGLKSIGRQEFPAIVRPLSGPGPYRYEVIAGARRHWAISWLRANNYPNFRYLVDVRSTLTDEEAFRISDIENRDRQDISDYERALDYARALNLYYRTQKEMADRLEVSEDWLSRFLNLAELPKEIVDAYADLREIRVFHARALGSALKSRTLRHALVRQAVAIRIDQQRRAEEGGRPLNGDEVIARLKAAVKPGPSPRSTTVREYRSTSGELLLKVAFQAKKGWTITVPPQAANQQKELVEAFRKALADGA